MWSSHMSGLSWWHFGYLTMALPWLMLLLVIGVLVWGLAAASLRDSKKIRGKQARHEVKTRTADADKVGYDASRSPLER